MAAKRLSVQEQNEIAFERICGVALAFKNEPGSHAWLLSELLKREIDSKNGILVDLHDLPGQVGIEYSGCWLTSDRRFVEFEITASRGRNQVIEVERWEDVTRSVEINPHCRGTGKSFGFLAIEAHRLIVGDSA